MRLLLQVVVRLGRKHQPDDVHFRGEIRSRIKPTCPGTKVSLSGRVQLLGVLEAVNAGDDPDGLFGHMRKSAIQRSWSGVAQGREPVGSVAVTHIAHHNRGDRSSVAATGIPRSALLTLATSWAPGSRGRGTPAVPGQPAGETQAVGWSRRASASSWRPDIPSFSRRAGGGSRRFGPRGTCRQRSLCCCGPRLLEVPRRALLV